MRIGSFSHISIGNSSRLIFKDGVLLLEGETNSGPDDSASVAVGEIEIHNCVLVIGSAGTGADPLLNFDFSDLIFCEKNKIVTSHELSDKASLRISGALTLSNDSRLFVDSVKLQFKDGSQLKIGAGASLVSSESEFVFKDPDFEIAPISASQAKQGIVSIVGATVFVGSAEDGGQNALDVTVTVQPQIDLIIGPSAELSLFSENNKEILLSIAT